MSRAPSFSTQLSESLKRTTSLSRTFSNNLPNLPNMNTFNSITRSIQRMMSETHPLYVKLTEEEQQVTKEKPAAELSDEVLSDLLKSECPICFDEIEAGDALIFICGKDKFHIVGKDCFEYQVNTKLKDNLLSITCIAEDCGNVVLKPENINLIYGDKFTAKMDEIQKYQADVENPNTRWCPTPDCRFTTIWKDKSIKKIDCKLCGKSFCGKCRETWEGNHTDKGDCIRKEPVILKTRDNETKKDEEKGSLFTVFTFSYWLKGARWREANMRWFSERPFFKIIIPFILIILLLQMETVVICLAPFVALGLICLIIVYSLTFFFAAVTWKTVFPMFVLAVLNTVLFSVNAILIGLGYILLALPLPILLSFVLIPVYWIVYDSKNSVSNAEITTACPRCSTPIERTDGCNHMICTVCKYEYCYICGKKWKSQCYLAHYSAEAEMWTKIKIVYQQGWKSGTFYSSRGMVTKEQRKKVALELLG